MGACKSRILPDKNSLNQNLTMLHSSRSGMRVRKKYEGVDKFGQLGKGSIGTIKEVVRRVDGEKFALKIVRTNGNRGALDNILNEINLLSQTSHPNVIKIYESYEEVTHNIYMVMQLCSGGDLFTRLLEAPQDHFNERSCAQLMSQILQSVNYLHSKKIVHRNLKLENFLFEGTSAGSLLKLSDFGFAEKVKSLIKTTFSSRVGTSYYIAPEVLQRNGTAASDMWSVGVIAYMIIGGKPPFDGANDVEILNKVSIGEYKMDDPVWSKISDEARSFVKGLLVFNPGERLTAKEALNHPWMTRAIEEHPTVHFDTKICENLKKFKTFSELKRHAISAVAFSLPADEIRKLESEFLGADKDHDGFITLEELKGAIREVSTTLSDDEVKEIFACLDIHHDGKIELREFVAACLSTQVYMNEHKLADAFHSLDVEHTGSISKTGLKKILGIQYKHSDLQRILHKFGGENGKIEYNEFMRMMKEHDKEEGN
eukprot:g3227.t1